MKKNRAVRAAGKKDSWEGGDQEDTILKGKEKERKR